MSKNPIESRRQKYFKLSSEIAQLNNEQLQALFDKSESSSGWGKNHVMILGESKVFVKCISMTNIEYDNLFSTKNLYDLPTYYNYGVGSAGFGVFRELIAHIKTTNWVLAGEIATFPLLYHYRIVPASGPRSAVDMKAHQSYVEYWGNSKNIGNYMLARANADYELVLFLEYLPYVLETWLQENPKRLQQPLSDLLTTIDFLRTKEIIHFDAHFHNILTDGERAYVTDFGLVLDRSFALTKAEEAFFGEHAFYDYGEILWSIGDLIRSMYENCAESDRFRLMEKYGIGEGLQPGELRTILLNNIEQIHADKIFDLDEFYVASIVKYRSIIMLMQSFFSGIRGNQKKDTKFPHTKLQRLLEESGLL